MTRSLRCSFARQAPTPALERQTRRQASVAVRNPEHLLFESEKCKSLHSCKYSYAQVSTVLACHSSLQSLHDEAGKGAVVCKGLGAVMHGDAY